MDTSWSQLESGTTWFHWTSAILGSFLVGLSGIIPLILLPQKISQNSDNNPNSNRNLNRQLSFAVGGLLGDVFLHLVPEAYSAKEGKIIKSSLEASITKLSFYHIRCFLLSTDAFTPNLAEFGPMTRARATNLVLQGGQRICGRLLLML